MALVANHAADRVEQLILLTERLAALVGEEADRIEARLPLPEGAEADEKSRLANAYRLELARVQQDPELIRGAPPPMLGRLKQRTVALNQALARHESALNAIKLVSEGLVQAMAEEIARQRSQSDNYGAGGARNAPAGPRPALLDRTA
ncbi:MAG: flagellar basal body protein [Proteobacteria bacterium]|nr:flagellar basal body protein [Pseudomonadota bacterium]